MKRSFPESTRESWSCGFRADRPHQAANTPVWQKTVQTLCLPAAFPQIANAIHLALGSAWIFLVAGEMVGAQSGLGYQIIDARNNVRADLLLATIFVIGIIGLLLDFLLGIVEKKVLRAWGGE